MRPGLAHGESRRPRRRRPWTRPRRSCRDRAWQRFAGATGRRASTRWTTPSAPIAIPFGVRVRDPRRRFAILQGVFAGLFLLGACPCPTCRSSPWPWPTSASWRSAGPGSSTSASGPPSSRSSGTPTPTPSPTCAWTALVSALQLLILFPLLYMQIQRHFGLYKVADRSTSTTGSGSRSTRPTSSAAGLVDPLRRPHQLDRLRLAVGPAPGAAVAADVRLHPFAGAVPPAGHPGDDPRGRRGGQDRPRRRRPRRLPRRPALIDKLNDPDRAVRGAAANVLTQIGDPEGLRQMSEAIHGAAK